MFEMKPDTPGFYYLVIKNPQFHVVVENISVEISFRMTSQAGRNG